MSAKVAVVLGYYKDDSLLRGVLKSLARQQYKDFDIYIYNNSGRKAALKKVKDDFPDIYIKNNVKNLGFAGGNNSVIRDLLNESSYEYIAILNDDTLVEPNWLRNLVEAIKRDKGIGAVTSKLIFFTEYVEIKGAIKSSDRKEFKWYEQSGFMSTHYPKKFYKEGLSGTVEDRNGKYRFCDKKFRMFLPIKDSNAAGSFEFVIKADVAEKTQLSLEIGEFKHQICIKPGVNSYKVEIPQKYIEKSLFNVVQNVGSEIVLGFKGRDRGSGEKDMGQYSASEDVQMFSGAATLFRVDALRQVGIFDETFFNYYEDSDLSMRLQNNDWRIVFEPEAVVRHYHSHSGKEWSPFFFFHANRNSVLFAVKNLDFMTILTAWKYVFGLLYRGLKSYVKAFLKGKISIGHYYYFFKKSWIFLLGDSKSLLKLEKSDELIQFGVTVKIFLSLLWRTPGALLKRFNFTGDY